MASPGTDLETLLVRHTVVSLAVQGLVERLTLAGILTPTDLVELREFALRLADQLKQHGSTGAQVGGDRSDAEIRAWWDPMGVPASTGRRSNGTSI